MEKPTDLFILDIATALWVAEGYSFHTAYIESVTEELSAALSQSTR